MSLSGHIREAVAIQSGGPERQAPFAPCPRQAVTRDHLTGSMSASVRAVTKAGHGTSAGWNSGCRCARCQRAHSDTQRMYGRARAQKRLPVELRQQLLDRIYAGQSFRSVLRDLNLTPNQVWGLTQSDEGWSTALEAALTASRRVDLQHGTNAAYVAGCVCGECRSHQRVRMAKQGN